MDVFADLCAGADGSPGVDHRTFIDIGADIDERRHHDDVFADIAAQTGDGGRYDTESASGEVFLRVVGELAADLVIKMQGGRAVGADRHGEIFLKAERKQDGFFGPLVDDPFAVFLFGHA